MPEIETLLAGSVRTDGPDPGPAHGTAAPREVAP